MISKSGSANEGLTAVELEEIHDQVRAVARDILGKAADKVEVDWSVLVNAGWLGLEVEEDLGGAGAGFNETGLILDEMGRAAATSSYLGSAVLGVGALQLIAPSGARDELFERLAAGALRVAVVLPTADDAVGTPRIPFVLNESADEGLVLQGATLFVPDAYDADSLILVAVDSSFEPMAVVVDRRANGFDVKAQSVLDSTRRLASVTAEAVKVDQASVLRFASPEGALRNLLDRGAAAIACDSLGIISAMLDETVGYASERMQFGRPIGSFQAVKHACADMLVAFKVASELVGVATKQVADGHADRSVAVSMAKSYVTEAAVQVTGKAVQLHGGIGYTWEAGIHVYQKRALLNRSLFGSPGAHRRRIAEQYTALVGY
jgi:alkylation response protein AidB-like acyl-CoA dehydrogenase